MADEINLDEVNLGKNNLWQIKCGATDRVSYEWEFKRYGIIQLGWHGYPINKGYSGNEEEYTRYKEEHKVKESLSSLKSFATRAEVNDYVLLTYGKKVVGAGQITGTYQFDKLKIFDDMDEWGWPHYRTVKWLRAGKEEFSNLPLSIESRFSMVKDADKYMEIIKKIEASSGYEEHYIELPVPEELSDNEFMTILDRLNINYNKFSEIKGRIKERYEKLSRITETETSVYLVLPLLELLGWNEVLHVRLEQSKQGKRRDITLYKNEKINAIIEVKNADKSLFNACDQIFQYCDDEECKTAIITDGLRYVIFKTDQKFMDSITYHDNITSKIYSYINLNHLDRKKHPLYLSDKGIETALEELSCKN